MNFILNVIRSICTMIIDKPMATNILAMVSGKTSHVKLLTMALLQQGILNDFSSIVKIIQPSVVQNIN